ncbi:clavesin-2-like [Achroia grisella]|uniref:clavesin-2-like n=1 Tax=Achroia grisella TaxID=688607 RepID=UPI0027D337E3|nr:clavesin-2-like [Achroia grisella]
MFKRFMEVTYEAEVMNTEEDEEFLALAAEKCNENITTRDKLIDELRTMVYERGECFPLRTDDRFLLRFLRARKFHVSKAHRLMVKYCMFREQSPHLWTNVDLWSLKIMKDVYEITFCDQPDIGRVGITRLGVWNTSEFDADVFMKAGGSLVEICARQPKLQILGLTLIVDLEGLTLNHVSKLTPTVCQQIVLLGGVATYININSCHLINYSWMMYTGLYVLKRFLPRQFLSKFHFHGKDLKSLQQHIPIDCLPERYGGTCRLWCSYDTWLHKIKKYRTKEFDIEMQQMGYVI